MIKKNVKLATSLVTIMVIMAFSPVMQAGLPNPGVQFEAGKTALLVTDPQNDFLSPKGVNNTVANIESLLKTAKKEGVPVFISPHYYYETDYGWEFEGALEMLMHSIKMFNRSTALSLDGFENSGADWLAQYKPYIEDGKTVISSPHKVYGPETNDLVLQLRKRGISKVIVAGMSANLCVEAHLRELLEQGFEVAVVKDATAGAQVPEGDGYQAALVNFRYLASAVVTTEEAVSAIKSGGLIKSSDK
jgi:nicotinamidase-related amidase